MPFVWDQRLNFAMLLLLFAASHLLARQVNHHSIQPSREQDLQQDVGELVFSSVPVDPRGRVLLR